MKVQVKLFAVVGDVVGDDEIAVELPETATVSDLKAKLLADYPALEGVLEHVMFAVDSQYAEPDQTLCEDAEVALIPPVSGG